MYNVLNVGKTGLKSMQFKMDAVANDLSNVNTYGYKSKEISFQELLNNQTINAGSKASVGKINFEQGNLIESPFDYNMAIEGMGFFGVLDENENLMLTRNGGFHINEDNTISDDNGYPLVVEYYESADQWSGKVNISNSGEIRTTDNESVLLGKVVLFQPENLDSLTSLGEGRYLPSENVELYDSINQGELFGSIVQFRLESSNVDIIDSMADMISTQRAYSLSAKAIQTTDDIMGMINSIKR